MNENPIKQSVCRYIKMKLLIKNITDAHMKIIQEDMENIIKEIFVEETRSFNNTANKFDSFEILPVER